MRPLILGTAVGALLVAPVTGEDTNEITEDKANETVSKMNVIKTNERAESDQPGNTSAGMYPESDLLDEQVDADDYQMQIVKNTSHIRIIVLRDENGQAQYKSIFMKNTNILEMIDLDQGLIFKGVLG